MKKLIALTLLAAAACSSAEAQDQNSGGTCDCTPRIAVEKKAVTFTATPDAGDQYFLSVTTVDPTPTDIASDVRLKTTVDGVSTGGTYDMLFLEETIAFTDSRTVYSDDRSSGRTDAGEVESIFLGMKMTLINPSNQPTEATVTFKTFYVVE